MPNTYRSQDTAQIHHRLQYPLRQDTRMGIEVSYLDSQDDPEKIFPSLSVDQGQSWNPISANEFSLPIGCEQFSIHLQINNDPRVRSDYRVKLVVKPLEHLSDFVNREMITIVEFTNAGSSSVIQIVPGELSVEEGKAALLTYRLEPPLVKPATFKAVVSPQQSLGTDIGSLRYTVDNTHWSDIGSSGLFLLSPGTETFSIGFDVLNDHYQLEIDEKVRITLEDKTVPIQVYGTPVSQEVTLVDKTILPNGVLINWYCEGTTKMGRYSDGVGGYTTQAIKERSPECGYVAAPKGTLLASYCANGNIYHRLADGNDGYYIELKTENHPDCGYTPQTQITPEDFTPAVWVKNTKEPIISNEGLGFASLKREGAYTEHSQLYGKWYWELKISRPTDSYQPISIGVAHAGHDMGSWIGATNQSWAWWAYDGTKYHNNVQGYYPGEINGQDIVSVLLDLDNHTVSMWLNGQDLGVMYDNLPDTKFYPVINAKDDSYALVNFGQHPFVYEPPSGYYKGFGPLKNPHPERGIVLRTYCDDIAQKEDIADGRGGFTTNVINAQSTECGYNPIPPAGTILKHYCDGTTALRDIADGQGGFTTIVYTYNSVQCGYQPPPVPDLIPAKIDEQFKQTNTVIDNQNTTANAVGTTISHVSVYSGKWYWEVAIGEPKIIVGIIQEGKGQANQLIGEIDNSFGLDTQTGELVIKTETNAVQRIQTGLSFDANDVIGLSLDFVAQRLSFYRNGVALPGVEISDLPIVNYVAATSVKGNEPASVDYHFGDDLIHEPPPAHIAGFGIPKRAFPRKGGIYQHFCQGVDQWVNRHDGGGGYYPELHEMNHVGCGYVPPPALGTVLGYICKQYSRYKLIADGNHGSTEELEEDPSTHCGYKPAGFLLSVRCEEYTRIGTYSDGKVPQGHYDAVIEENSRACGYKPPNSNDLIEQAPNSLTSNLPINYPEGLKIEVTPIPLNNALVIKKPIQP